MDFSPKALWSRVRNVMRFSSASKSSLRDKAIAVADRVTTLKKGEGSKVSCPICFDLIQTRVEEDLRMTLAVHMSLWHPDDVLLQWDFMQQGKNKNNSSIHMPSFIFGAGIAVGLGALLALSAKNQHQLCSEKRRK